MITYLRDRPRGRVYGVRCKRCKKLTSDSAAAADLGYVNRVPAGARSKAPLHCPTRTIVGGQQPTGIPDGVLSVSLVSTRIGERSALELCVRVTNTGRAAWLPEGAPSGPVRLGSRLLDTNGTWISDSFSRSLLPVRSPVKPGESVSFVAKIQARHVAST